MSTGHIDEYTRVEILLPFKSREEISAARDMIDYVKNARVSGRQHRYKGLTHSAQLPPVFHGVWWDKSRRKWVIDRLIILILDLAIPYSNQQAVSSEATELKHRAHDFYVQAKAQQVEMWVVAYAIGYVS